MADAQLQVYSAQTIALTLPELLSCIFEWATKSTQSVCARVCKRWEGPALGALWYELAAPMHLFQILGEFYNTGDGIFVCFSFDFTYVSLNMTRPGSDGADQSRDLA